GICACSTTGTRTCIIICSITGRATGISHEDLVLDFCCVGAGGGLGCCAARTQWKCADHCPAVAHRTVAYPGGAADGRCLRCPVCGLADDRMVGVAPGAVSILARAAHPEAGFSAVGK